MSSDHQLHRAASFHTRFTDQVKKMKFLKKSSKTTLSSPAIMESSGESSSIATSSSSSSVLESQATSITQSSASLSPPVTQRHSPDRRKQTRPKSDCYSSKRLSGIPSSTSMQMLSSPLAPRILSVQENQWVHQSLLLVFGQVGLAETPVNSGSITVHHHLDGCPQTQWPISEGYFKALVRLDPGPNKLRFEYNASKIPAFSTNITLNMLPLAASPPLHLAVLLGKDSMGGYGFQGEHQENEGSDTETAVKKLRMAAYLAQAFTGEQMFRNRLGRRCFRLEEEWSPDTLSNYADGALRNLARVHILRSESTVDEIQNLENAQNGERLREVVQKAVDSHFGTTTPPAKRYIAVVLLDAKGDLQFKEVSGHSALIDGLGIVGSHFLNMLPSCIEEVVPSFSDCTRIGGNAHLTTLSEAGCFWEAATAALGVMIEAFLSPQNPTEPRDFATVNRTFVIKESYCMRTKSPGLRLSLPQEECVWPRVDCLRFRYHPCFRLPTDPILPPLPDAPQIYSVENGIVVTASSGITLILIYSGDVYQNYLEYTSKPEREVLLQEDFIRSKVPDIHRSTPVKLKIYSAGQGESIVDDFYAARNLKVQLPNGCGAAFRSASSGCGTITESQKQEVILHSITTGRMLTAIRVFHNSTALDGLEFLYEDSSSQLFGHRGSTDDAKQSVVSDFVLDARKGEILMGFCIRAGTFVNGIEILTSFGRRSSIFGNPQGGSISKTLVPPRGRSIAGVAGSCADRVDGFSILYK